MRQGLLCVGIMLAMLSCGHKNDKEAENLVIPPFELVVTNYDYSLAYSIKYIVTEKELIILYEDELEPDSNAAEIQSAKSNVLLDTLLAPSLNLRDLALINLHNLKPRYKTKGVSDGTQISVWLTKDNITKKIHVSNYYHPAIGRIVECINEISPKKYQINYDKEGLLKLMKNRQQ